jgi:hypothetical protein
MPPTVDEAFKSFCYVPYSSLTSVVRLKAARGEEDFILNANCGPMAKAFDRRCKGNFTDLRRIQSKYIIMVDIIHNTCLAKGNPKRTL